VTGVLAAVRVPTSLVSMAKVDVIVGLVLTMDVAVAPMAEYAAAMALADVAENPTAFCRLKDISTCTLVPDGVWSR